MNHECAHPLPTITAFTTITAYVDALVESGHWDEITATEETFTEWLGQVFSHDSWGFLSRSDNRLLEAITGLHPSPSHVFPIAHDTKIHLDYLDALAAGGVSWQIDPENISFLSWLEHHNRDLSSLVAVPEARAALLDDLSFVLNGFHNDSYETDLATLLAYPATRRVVVDKLTSMAEAHGTVTGSQEAWEDFLKDYGWLQRADLHELNPDAIDTLFRFDPAAELAVRLQRGTLVEYTWPEYEKVMADIDGDVVITEHFPFVGIAHGTTLTLLGGQHPHTFTIPTHENLRRAIPVGDDLFLHFDDPEGASYWWASTNTTTRYETPAHILDTFHTDSYTLGNRTFFGDVELTPGKELTTEPAGELFGQNILYHRMYVPTTPGPTILHGDAPDLTWDDFHEQLRAGTLPGIPVFPDSIREIPDELSFRFSSFIHPVTEETAASPLGAINNYHFCYRFEGDIDDESVAIGPLGYFTVGDGARTPLTRPSGGIWFASWYEICDGETRAQIAPSRTHTGDEHSLHKLQVMGFHHLMVRHKDVSQRMRECTDAQAKELLTDPTAILSFADYDEVLAAAIAGIVADIASIKEFGVDLPALDEIPDYLTYLYVTYTKENH